MKNRIRRKSIHDRVSYAAGQLDQVRPGWEKEIDVDQLNIGCPYRCIAGQLVGDFENYGRLGLKGSSASNGMQSVALEVVVARDEYRLLTDAWKHQISKRGVVIPSRPPTTSLMERVSWWFMAPFLRFA